MNNISKLELWLAQVVIHSAVHLKFWNLLRNKISLRTTSLGQYFYCLLKMYITSIFCLLYFFSDVIFNHSHNPISLYHFLINERPERWTSRNVMFCIMSTEKKRWPVAEIWIIKRFIWQERRNFDKISCWRSDRPDWAIFLILRYGCNQRNNAIIFLFTFWIFDWLILYLN